MRLDTLITYCGDLFDRLGTWASRLPSDTFLGIFHSDEYTKTKFNSAVANFHRLHPDLGEEESTPQYLARTGLLAHVLPIIFDPDYDTKYFLRLQTSTEFTARVKSVELFINQKKEVGVDNRAILTLLEWCKKAMFINLAWRCDVLRLEQKNAIRKRWPEQQRIYLKLEAQQEPVIPLIPYGCPELGSGSLPVPMLGPKKFSMSSQYFNTLVETDVNLSSFADSTLDPVQAVNTHIKVETVPIVMATVEGRIETKQHEKQSQAMHQAWRRTVFSDSYTLPLTISKRNCIKITFDFANSVVHQTTDVATLAQELNESIVVKLNNAMTNKQITGQHIDDGIFVTRSYPVMQQTLNLNVEHLLIRYEYGGEFTIDYYYPKNKWLLDINDSSRVSMVKGAVQTQSLLPISLTSMLSSGMNKISNMLDKVACLGFMLIFFDSNNLPEKGYFNQFMLALDPSLNAWTQFKIKNRIAGNAYSFPH